MKRSFSHRQIRQFSVRVVFPVFLAGLLFVLAIFFFLIPSMQRQLMERKKETIRELTLVAWSVLDSYYQQERSGMLTREEAQHEGAARVENMRYGQEGKDYYWITDMHPTMVMHPYRTDLNGEDLTEFEDSNGKRMFAAFVDAVRADGAGYVDYYWQWQDEPDQIVPKLSYVMAFEPWGWVLGTGIYVEDVVEDIQRIEQNLIYASLAITAVMVLILFYIVRQSLHIEQKRSRAEEALKQSHEKYRALVESSTEGTLLILEGRCAYSNKVMLDLLGYDEDELSIIEIFSLLVKETEQDRQALQNVEMLLLGDRIPHQFEARLKSKSGEPVEVLLTATRISIAEKSGIILIARDVTHFQELHAALGESRRQAKNLTQAINLGIFRSTWSREKTMLVEANPALREILGLSEDTNLEGMDWLETITDSQERSALVSQLNSEGQVEGFQLRLKPAAGEVLTVSCFAMLVNGENGETRFCDGILEDISKQKKVEEERDGLIAQLQASLLFPEEPIENLMGKAVTCSMNQTIASAAALMNRSGSSALVVTGSGGELVGMVTDHDLRARVIAAGLAVNNPVFEIISAPLLWISSRALVYEAILLMQDNDVSCLAVKDSTGELKGIVRHRDLLRYRKHSAMILTNRIQHAQGIDEIQTAYEQLPYLIKAMIDTGTRVRHINRMISSISDGITSRLLEMAMDELGPPPVQFSFLSLGSEGREEQTLVTDQDNAILYEDPPPDRARETSDYFLAMGTKVCDELNQAGYAYCKGGIMAKNTRWNQPLSVWKQNFHHWIRNANPQELLELNKMFDFRCVSGEKELTSALHDWILKQMQEYQPFFLHFAQNALLYKPPLGLFGNILTESSAEGLKTLNLKDALMPVVKYARLYTLKYQIEETHTLDRLAGLHKKGALSSELFEEIAPAYETIMRMRLQRQASAVQAGRRPNNRVSTEDWTAVEEVMLKRMFSLLNSLRKKISYDFLGVA